MLYAGSARNHLFITMWNNHLGSQLGQQFPFFSPFFSQLQFSAHFSCTTDCTPAWIFYMCAATLIQWNFSLAANIIMLQNAEKFLLHHLSEYFFSFLRIFSFPQVKEKNAYTIFVHRANERERASFCVSRKTYECCIENIQHSPIHSQLCCATMDICCVNEIPFADSLRPILVRFCTTVSVSFIDRWLENRDFNPLTQLSKRFGSGDEERSRKKAVKKLMLNTNSEHQPGMCVESSSVFENTIRACTWLTFFPSTVSVRSEYSARSAAVRAFVVEFFIFWKISRSSTEGRERRRTYKIETKIYLWNGEKDNRVKLQFPLAQNTVNWQNKD